MSARRAAVVINPTRVDADVQRRLVTRLLADSGWEEPLWFETTAADPGVGQARAAVAAGVDLVLSCGGDGTVRACAHALAGTGVPLAFLPAGTGNLLARNLDLPLDTETALAVALHGRSRPVDLGRLDGEGFVVMAGMGVDARMLAETPEGLKKAFGWPAYGLGIVRSLRTRPLHLRIRVDDADPVERVARGVIIGNVGRLQGRLPLLPDAEPGDGVLDLVLVAPRGLRDWVRVVWMVVRRRRKADHRLERMRGRHFVVEADHDAPCELDGDVVPDRRVLDVTVEPGALTVRVPAASESRWRTQGPATNLEASA